MEKETHFSVSVCPTRAPWRQRARRLPRPTGGSAPASLSGDSPIDGCGTAWLASLERRPMKPRGEGRDCPGRGKGLVGVYDSRSPSAADGPHVRSLLMPPDPPPRRAWFLWVLLVLLTLLLVLLGVGILDWFEL